MFLCATDGIIDILISALRLSLIVPPVLLLHHYHLCGRAAHPENGVRSPKLRTLLEWPPV